ncbi:hypothetical protein F5Y03DRAFT_409439 [Xylaria venustula]|nr:hypothetical protein F5Y03DRAFT_409439 [Xylaria venustula]
MAFRKTLAVVGLIASPVLASTPQGYGYGGETDTLLSASTDSPESLPSAITPVTLTDSITITKPFTVTHTVTVSQDDCGGDETTIYSTTRTTRTTQDTIYISVSPTPETIQTPKTPIPVYTSVSGSSSSSVTSSVTSSATSSSTNGVSVSASASASSSSVTSSLSFPTASITGFSNTTTTCDESITSTGDVDGATASLSTSSTSSANTLTLAFPPTQETTSTVVSGTAVSTTGVVTTRTSTYTVPFPTISTAMGVRGVADARLVAGAMGIVSLVFILVL